MAAGRSRRRGGTCSSAPRPHSVPPLLFAAPRCLSLCLAAFVTTLLLDAPGHVAVFAAGSSTSTSPPPSSALPAAERDENAKDRAALFRDLLNAPSSLSSYAGDVQSAISDLDRAVPSSPVSDDATCAEGSSPPTRGEAAWSLLSGMASSPTFVRRYWHRHPVLIRSQEVAEAADRDGGGWVGGLFTVERDLRLVGGSYITGHRTADALRDGTQTDTWAFRPIKDDPARPTTWEEVEDGLRGGTIYFNTAGSLWPSLGALCRLTSAAFGLPTNVNIYITPPGVSTSVPPHTDRQDVLVFHTAGAKRWRVYAPPAPRKKGVDPLNRGKNGDVLGYDELGPPLIDTVVRRGDVLYVPTGFPHTTDTCTAVDADEGGVRGEEPSAADSVFNETSVHLTMGLDSHVWGLTYAHLRWSALQRCRKAFALNIEDDGAYWEATETIPAGFLGGEGARRCLEGLRRGESVDGPFRDAVVAELKRVLVLLEPNRWIVEGSDAVAADVSEGGDATKERESLPTDEELAEVIDYMFRDHLLPLLDLQEDMFCDIDPTRDDTIMKAYQSTQQQNKIMEQYGTFSKNDAMSKGYAQRRLERDERTKTA